MKTLACTKRYAGAEAAHEDQRGFSMIELIVVFAIIVIMSATAMFMYAGHRNAYRTEDQALQIIDFLRDAQQRALTQRKIIRAEINATDDTMRIYDARNTANKTADDLPLRTLRLQPRSAVRLADESDWNSQPGGITVLPPSPANFAAATFSDIDSKRIWAINFKSNGTAVNDAGALTNATLMFWEPRAAADANTAKDNKAVRSVTIFGGMGAVRYWQFNGTAFVAK